MALIIIENEPKKNKRPSLIDSNLFIAFNGKLYEGHYLKQNTNSQTPIIGIKYNRN